MSQANPSARQWLLIERSSDGTSRSIPFTGLVQITAIPGGHYALIDPATGRSPAGLQLKRKGDALLVEQQGEEPLVEVTDFYQQQDVGFMPQAELNGSELTGASIGPDAAVLETTASGEVIIWRDAGDGSSLLGSALALSAWAAWGVAAASLMASDDSNASGTTDGITGMSSTVTGTIVGGPVIDGHDLIVEVFQADGSTLLGIAEVDASGNFTTRIGDYQGVIIVKVVNGGSNADYLDEASNSGKDLNAEFFATEVVRAPNSTVTVNLNALTTLAYLKAVEAAAGAPLATSQVDTSNAALAELSGLDSLHAITIVPLNGGHYDGSDGLNPGEIYGALLAALSGADANNSGDSQQTLDDLLGGLNIDSDGKASLNAVAQQIFIDGANRIQQETGEDLSEALLALDTQAPVFSSPGTVGPLGNNSGAGQVVYTAAAADNFGGITYSLKDGGDQAAFSINPVTGEVTLIGNPDHASQNSYSFTVIARDTAGNTSELAITLDILSGPVVTLADDTPAFVQSSAEITLQSSANGTLYLVHESITVTDAASITGQPDGQWNAVGTTANTSVSLSLDGLQEGTYYLYAFDENGGLTQVPHGITLDDTPPAAPTLAVDASGFATVTDLESGATWQYSTDGGTTWQQGSGDSLPIASGDYAAGDIQVRQTDAAGNTSTTGSNPGDVLVIDITPPVAPVLSIDPDGLVTLTELEICATWQYSLDGGQTWQDGSGDSFQLPDGNYTAGDIQVRQSDFTGNTGAAAANTAVLSIDMTPPDATLLPPPSGRVQLEAPGNTTGSDLGSQITALGSDGAFAVTWYGQDSEGDDSVFVQRFSADGSLAGATVQLEALGSSGSDMNPQITALGSDGAFAVAWQGTDSDGDYSIFVQRFNADGSLAGETVQLEALDNTAGIDRGQRITALGSDGAFVVTWSGEDSEADGGDLSIFVQCFNADGSLAGETVQLEALNNTTGIDYGPNITALGSDGAFAVTWIGQDSAADGGDWSIFVQRFNADGSLAGDAVRLEPLDQPGGKDEAAQITALGSDGAFVVTWMGYTLDGTDRSVFLQRFNADGSLAGDPVLLEARSNPVSGNRSNQHPQVSALGDDGSFVVVWYGHDDDSSNDTSIFVQRFDADGDLVGDRVKLEALTTSRRNDYYPQVTALGSDGAFAVTWQGQGASGTFRIFVQSFNADGSLAHASPIQLEGSSNTAYIQERPQITALGENGTFAVTWYGQDTDGDYSVFVQRFNADGTFAAGAALYHAGQSATVQSSEVGTAYLVHAAIAVTDVASITAAAGEFWNAVAITAADTSTALALAGLADGEYRLYTADAAGNLSTAATQTLTVDGSAPVAPGLGIDSEGHATLTGLEDNASWQYSLDGGITWRNGSGNSFRLPDGDYVAGDIQVRQTDAAGNTGEATGNAAALSIDTLLPTATLVLPPLGSAQLEALDNTTGDNLEPQITALGSDGDFVVTWYGTDSEGDDSIFVQRFSADGRPNGERVMLEAIDNTSGGDMNVRIAALGSDGAFAVVWHGVGANGFRSIYLQRFNADGSPGGDVVQLPGAANINQYPQVTALGNDGAFVVVWHGREASSGSAWRIYVQRYDADGNPEGDRVTMQAPDRATASNNFYAEVTALGTDGAFAVTWQGRDVDNDDSIYVQRFNAAGEQAGAIVKLEALNKTNGHDQYPQITALGSAGAFVVTWHGQDSDSPTDYSIFVQRFNADGSLAGATVQLEALNKTNGHDQYPQITALGSDGAFVVTWTGVDSGGDNSIFVQRFNTDGSLAGATVQLEALNNTTGNDLAPQISALGTDGAFVVTWYGVDSDGDRSIFVQRFNADGSKSHDAPIQLEARSNTSGNDHYPQVTALGTDGAFVVTWYGQNSGGNNSVYVQRFNADGTPVEDPSGEFVTVQSTEPGTAYLVHAAIDVTDVASITAAADEFWNAVAITSANTDTALALTGLTDGEYRLYTVDAAGNLSTAAVGTLTVEGSTVPGLNTRIVVFDLVAGVSSDHSGRTFDADTSYIIHVRVDDSGSLNTDGTSGNASATWGTWLGADNLGADDKIVLVGASDAGKGDAGPSSYQWQSPGDLPQATLAATGVFELAGAGSLDLWDGMWASPNGNQLFADVYFTAMPAGVLTSQGLA